MICHDVTLCMNISVLSSEVTLCDHSKIPSLQLMTEFNLTDREHVQTGEREPNRLDN